MMTIEQRKILIERVRGLVKEATRLCLVAADGDPVYAIGILDVVMDVVMRDISEAKAK